MQVREKSNILTRMGAYLDVGWKGEKTFYPGRAKFYAVFVKTMNLAFGLILLWLHFSQVGLVWFILLGTVIMFNLSETIKVRSYNRRKELLSMSLMEIMTIFLPIPIMLGILESGVLMAAGVMYFFLVNLWIWGTPFPRV